MHLPPLYAIVDAEVCAARRLDPRRVAEAFLEGGARLLQVRAKTLGGADFLALASAIVAAATTVNAQVIINDRADLALLARAAGVHVGQDDLSVRDIRHLVGADMLVGLSTHTSAQIAAAVHEPISYLAVGPVYRTVTKATGYEAVGLDMLREAAPLAAAAGIGVVAIGGITLEQVGAVWAAGATSVAVITDLLTGDDPASRTAAFLEAAGGGAARRN